MSSYLPISIELSLPMSFYIKAGRRSTWFLKTISMRKKIDNYWYKNFFFSLNQPDYNIVNDAKIDHHRLLFDFDYVMDQFTHQ